MLRLIQIGNTMPLSYPVSTTDAFQPGQVAQLKVLGNEIVCGVSDGTAPLGLIDDVNTRISGAQAEGCSPVANAFAEGIDIIKPVKPKTGS